MSRRIEIIFGLLIVVAITTTCAEARAGTRPTFADKPAYEQRLADLCEFHSIRFCPRLSWEPIKPGKVKDGEIHCGYDADRNRLCRITLWTRADMGSLDHEFAHFLTWLKKSDPKLGHYKAFKQAQRAVGTIADFASTD